MLKRFFAPMLVLWVAGCQSGPAAKTGTTMPAGGADAAPRVVGGQRTEPAGDGSELLAEARVLREAGDGLKESDGKAAAVKYRQAIAKLDEYGKRFGRVKGADGVAMEIGRISQDGLGDSPGRVAEIFKKFLTDYPESVDRAEAMYRLGQAYERGDAARKALAIYGQCLEEYPRSPWADKAIFSRGKLLGEAMDKMNKKE